MRRRVSRIFTALNRPRLGVRGQEAEVRHRLYGRRFVLGAIGLAPSLKCEAPESKSGASTTTTTVRRSR